MYVMYSSAVVLGCTMAACVIVGLWKILNTKLGKLVARLQHSMMDVFMELLLVTHNHRAEEPLTGKQLGRLRTPYVTATRHSENQSAVRTQSTRPQRSSRRHWCSNLHARRAYTVSLFRISLSLGFPMLASSGSDAPYMRVSCTWARCYS